jgi:phosphotransferase system enzyme I (PtsI)
MNEKQEILLKGIPSSPGIAIGKACLIKPEAFINYNERIAEVKIQSEIERLDDAVNSLIRDYEEVLEKVKLESQSVSAIIETNLIIVADAVFLESIRKRILSGYTAESSVAFEFDKMKNFLKSAPDPFMRERSTELDHIRDRLLATLKNRGMLFSVEKGSIVVAQSISPSDIVKLKEACVEGIITEAGGITSHSSILARSFEIPEVIGVKEIFQTINTGDKIIIDGFNGIIAINPEDGLLANYEAKKARIEEQRSLLGDLVRKPSVTLDGKSIRLLANVDFPNDVENAAMVGAEGIGLTRTEHLFISSNGFPTEEFQYKYYKEIAERAYPYPVTFRVFDLGGDKFTEGVSRHEDNPALGFRGIRLLLNRKDIFTQQIKAILRSSVNKNVRLMLPMICSLKEIIDSKAIIEECKNELRSDFMDFDESIPIGIMIETPAAAIISNELAKNCDFFSIGTNDLTQYTLAADRTNELMSDTYDAFHPAVLRLIRFTVESAKKHNIPVSVCGELASHAAATSLLIGLGVDEFSVSPSILLGLKKRVRELNSYDSTSVAEEALLCSNHDELLKEMKS